MTCQMWKYKVETERCHCDFTIRSLKGANKIKKYAFQNKGTHGGKHHEMHPNERDIQSAVIWKKRKKKFENRGDREND